MKFAKKQIDIEESRKSKQMSWRNKSSVLPTKPKGAKNDAASKSAPRKN